jgi:hypothetical protein
MDLLSSTKANELPGCPKYGLRTLDKAIILKNFNECIKDLISYRI